VKGRGQPITPNDPWQHARIVDVLVEMAGSVAIAMKPAVDDESSNTKYLCTVHS